MEFLNKNHHLIIDGKQIISDSALVAITLMIAESKPEDDLYYELKSLENRSTYGTNGSSTLYAAVEMLVERSI